MIPREATRAAVADVKSRDHYFGIDALGPGGLDSNFQELMIAFQLWDYVSRAESPLQFRCTLLVGIPFNVGEFPALI